MNAILTISILSLLCSVTILMVSIAKYSNEKCASFVLFMVLSSLLVVGTFTCVILSSTYVMLPNESDIIHGRAHYAENIYVNNGDTIKTYSIIWNKKCEYEIR